MSFLTAAELLAPELLALKEDLHRHPEVSFRELRSTALLREKLAALGLELIDIGMESGVVALLRGGLPGKTLALRADIDAIFQQEPAAAGSSEVPGVMHACGHDFHSACLYGAAKLLAAERAGLRGNVVFLFQPAEEITRGAAAMVEHGLWDALPQRPCALFGLHNRPELPRGQIAVIEGPIMAGKIHFEMSLRGLAGHGGSPHKCIDVIVPGAAIVSALQSVVSRNTDPMDALVCSVCSIHAGTPENFAPDLLTMTGCIRAHRDEVLEHAQKRIWTLARGIGESYGCAVEVQFIPQVPVTYNAPEMTAIARRAALSLVPVAQVVSPPPDLGSEDFAVLGQEIPSFFYWLGSGFPGKKNACWHSPDFRTDDGALPLGAALLAQVAVEGLGGQ